MNRRFELCNGLDRLKINWTEVQVEGILRYLDELLLWNPTHGLVGGAGGSREAPSDLVARHVLDSLAPLMVLTAGHPRTLADIGSGAGFPGIPLALFLPETQVTLVEKQERRCRFLRNAVAVLGLKERIEVEQGAMEHLKKRFDLVVLRAFGALPAVYSDLRALTSPGGRIAAYKGRRERATEEARRLEDLPDPPVEVEIFPLDVPFLKAERNLVLLNPYFPPRDCNF